MLANPLSTGAVSSVGRVSDGDSETSRGVIVYSGLGVFTDLLSNNKKYAAAPPPPISKITRGITIIQSFLLLLEPTSVVATCGVTKGGLEGKELLIGCDGATPIGVLGVYGEAAEPKVSEGGRVLAGGYDPNCPDEAGLA